eukprot:350583-Chlamydomonas_euryale.AAC.4
MSNDTIYNDAHAGGLGAAKALEHIERSVSTAPTMSLLFQLLLAGRYAGAPGEHVSNPCPFQRGNDEEREGVLRAFSGALGPGFKRDRPVPDGYVCTASAVPG